MTPSSAYYRSLVHKCFSGVLTPAELKAKGLPPIVGRKAQMGLSLGAGREIRPQERAGALKAAQEEGKPH